MSGRGDGAAFMMNRIDEGIQPVGDIFISHVEEDQAIAVELAQGLEANGYSTWYFERDGLPCLIWNRSTRPSSGVARSSC